MDSHELARDQGMAGEIVRVALKYANVSTLRRLGKLLELEGVKDSILRKLERKLAVFRLDTMGADFAEAGYRGSAMGSCRQL